MLRPITASDPCGGVERTRIVVERHLAILAGKDESERKRACARLGLLKRGEELLTACEVSPLPEAAC
jgi:hypothetical protein